MAALVAAALAGVGDKPPWLAAILADRHRAPGTLIVAALLAMAGASAIAASLGTLLALRLTPEAKLLMLALALGLQGGGGLFPVKAPDRLTGWRLGAFLNGLLGLFILAFGDGVQFIVLALAARTPLPGLAAAGATFGMLATIVPAVLLGEAGWLALPLRPVRIAVSMLFLLVAAVLALQALGLA